jgi:hypothetical protein
MDYQTFLQLRFRSEKSIPAVSPTQTDYTDRITKIKRQTRPRRVTYASFSRQLGSLSDLRAQYSYAYRTLVACMVQRNIGVEEHHTPAEACEIVLQKTNYREMGALTDLFLRLVYAGDQTVPDDELQAATKTACEIVKGSIVTIS